MKNKQGVVTGAVIIGVIIIGGFVLSQITATPGNDVGVNRATSNDGTKTEASSGGRPERKLREAPMDTEFQDKDGVTVTLSQFAGTPLVVNSWATWCPFCVNELPDFAEVQQEFGSQIRVIAIDRAESLRQSQKFTDELGITDDLIFWLDPRDRYYAAIGGFAMPETLFITPDGKIAFHKRGFMSLEEMRSLINQHLLN